MMSNNEEMARKQPGWLPDARKEARWMSRAKK